MTAISENLDRIRRVHEKIGTAELARISGVPYTTVRECEMRDFGFKPLDTLEKLTAAAVEYEEANQAPAIGPQP